MHQRVKELSESLLYYPLQLATAATQLQSRIAVLT